MSRTLAVEEQGCLTVERAHLCQGLHSYVTLRAATVKIERKNF